MSNAQVAQSSVAQLLAAEAVKAANALEAKAAQAKAATLALRSGFANRLSEINTLVAGTRIGFQPIVVDLPEESDVEAIKVFDKALTRLHAEVDQRKLLSRVDLLTQAHALTDKVNLVAFWSGKTPTERVRGDGANRISTIRLIQYLPKLRAQYQAEVVTSETYAKVHEELRKATDLVMEIEKLRDKRGDKKREGSEYKPLKLAVSGSSSFEEIALELGALKQYRDVICRGLREQRQPTPSRGASIGARLAAVKGIKKVHPASGPAATKH